VRSFSFTSSRAGEWNGAEVFLTASWLVYLWGEEASRMSVQRLADLVAAARAKARERGQAPEEVPGPVRGRVVEGLSAGPAQVVAVWLAMEGVVPGKAAVSKGLVVKLKVALAFPEALATVLLAVLMTFWNSGFTKKTVPQ
jgi:hypothetical protein